jgi:hypothetical protein
MPSAKAVSQGITEFEYREINWRSSWPRFIIQQLAALSNVLAPTPDASQTVGGNAKLSRKSGVDISRFGMFPVEKANDHLLLELHEKRLNSTRIWSSLENKIMFIDLQGGKFDLQALKLTLVSSLNDMYHFLEKV